MLLCAATGRVFGACGFGSGRYIYSFKVHDIQQFPIPKTTRALRSFLGLAGFYRRFIRSYAIIAAPLVRLTTTDSFQWAPEAQLAFDSLKQALSFALVLALPNFELPFTVETNALGVGMGVVLSQ